MSASAAPLPPASTNRGSMEPDREIDLLVYELYGLTEEEIKIVEEIHQI